MTVRCAAADVAAVLTSSTDVFAAPAESVVVAVVVANVGRRREANAGGGIPGRVPAGALSAGGTGAGAGGRGGWAVPIHGHRRGSCGTSIDCPSGLFPAA